MDNSNDHTFLAFYLGNELLGINVLHILEVLKDAEITDIPKTEDFIEGVINFRGEIVTVIDFNKKLHLPENAADVKKLIIVVELHYPTKSIKVGLLANKVKRVFEINDSDIKAVPEFGQYYNPEYLLGVTKSLDGLVTLLDLEKVLNDKDVEILLESNVK